MSFYLNFHDNSCATTPLANSSSIEASYLNMMSTYNEEYPLKDDPLTISQKKKIVEFVHATLLSNETEKIRRGYSEVWVRKNIFAVQSLPSGDSLKALSKTYHTNTLNLELAKKGIDTYHKGTDLTFDRFRKALADPIQRSKEFALDQSNHAQLLASQIFMKVVIRGIMMEDDYDRVHDQYLAKMTSAHSGRVNSSISPKNSMLMKNQPLARSPGFSYKAPLDAIMANTYFEVPKHVSYCTTTEPGKGPVTEKIVLGPSEVEAKRIMISVFTDLMKNPDLKHVMEGLGTVIAKEKGNLFFSDNTFGTGVLGEAYGAESSALGGHVGFYNRHHSIFMSALINPFDKKVDVSAVATFIHESLHFIFQVMLNAESSPVKRGSKEEFLFDEALNKDRQHRQKLDKNKLGHEAQRVWHTLVDVLEKDQSYFSGGFNPSNSEHLHTMRVEAIVRVMEQRALSTPVEEIKKVAPLLCDFYLSHAKPMIEKYVQENAILFKSAE